MINATDLKNGTTFLSASKPYIVIKYSHIKMGRGGAIVRVTARNLESGTIEEKTFSSNVKVEDVKTIKRKLQFLYTDGANAVFMDPSSYEQVEIPQEVVKDELAYIGEGDKVDVLFWSKGGDKEDKPLSIDIPPKVVLTIAETDPGVKGNSATNIYKQAKLSNGVTLKVPLFIKEGDKIRVDTRTREYVERVTDK